MRGDWPKITSHFSSHLQALDSKKTGTISRPTRPHGWMKLTWRQPCRSKIRVGKKLYWTFTFHCPLLTKDKNENCQKIRNLGLVFRNRLCVLSRKGPRWPANWATCQPPCWLQDTVCRYLSSLFRVQCLQTTITVKAFTQNVTIFVTVTGKFLKQLVHYILSSNHLCKFTETIIRLRLSKCCWIVTSPSPRGLFNNTHWAWGE